MAHMGADGTMSCDYSIAECMDALLREFQGVTSVLVRFDATGIESKIHGHVGDPVRSLSTIDPFWHECQIPTYEVIATLTGAL